MHFFSHPLLESLLFLSESLVLMVSILFALRALLTWAKAPLHHPLAYTLWHMTDPWLMPLRALTERLRCSQAALSLSVVFCVNIFGAWFQALLFNGFSTHLLGIVLLACAKTLYILTLIYGIVAALWTLHGVFPHLLAQTFPLVEALMRPVYRRFARWVPKTGALDWTPFLLLLSLGLFYTLIVKPMYFRGYVCL